MSAALPTGEAALRQLRERLGADVPEALLTEALTHRSYAYENGNLRPNERLEFLGDSVLGIVITSELFTRHPDLPEGQLAKMRSAVVNSKALADLARELDLGGCLLLGKGEKSTGGADKTSILADSLEALFGAVYLAAGLEAAADLILRLTGRLLAQTATLGAGLDWKTSLQELTSRLGLGVPEYVISESGPDHAKFFVAVVSLNDGQHGTGSGRTKKEAEQVAAQVTFESLESASVPATAASGGSAATAPTDTEVARAQPGHGQSGARPEVPGDNARAGTTGN